MSLQSGCTNELITSLQLIYINMEAEHKNKLFKILAAALLLIAAVLIEKTIELKTWVLLLLYLPSYIIAGYETLLEAAESISKGEALDENFLMAIATIGALTIGFLPGGGTYFPEAVFVMLFFQVGELFEEMAEGRSRKSIAHLMDIRPDFANVIRGGEIIKLNPQEVQKGEIIIIKPGEKVPLDGVVAEGTSNLDTVALTGESVPRRVSEGDEILSGCINISGAVKVRVLKEFGESTASKIIELVENASEHKSRSEKFITRFAKVYTPIVVLSALVLAFLPPLFSGSFSSSFPVWLYRALTFLVISCPCALVISVPLTFFGGIGAASKRGVLVKGSNYLDLLAKTETVVFDKTGTLTEGVFEVTAVHPDKFDENRLLHLAAHVERFSNHPIAASLKAAYPNENDSCEVSDVEEYPGYGVSAKVNGQEVCVGNFKMMEMKGVEWRPCEKTGTIAHVSVEGEYYGHIVISDRIREDSASAVALLRKEGVKRLCMFTGDKEEVAAMVAGNLGLDAYRAELLPEGKVSELEKMLAERQKSRPLAFVGDGINDAPVLARADVGVAMGGLGSDAAIEAADVVLMDDKPSKLPLAIGIAKKTLRIAGENVVFAIGVKLLCLILSVFGLATMWMAVFADVGVTVLAVLNAMRMLKGAGSDKL